MEQEKKMVQIIYKALEDKKGENICIIDISHISVLADYFIITNGTSDNQVKALVENVEEKMQEAGFPQKQREGQKGGTWVLLDYGNVIVHVFDKDNRNFYDLERIWSDGKRISNLDDI